MALTVDWLNKIVDSDSSITDLPAFKDEVRGLEDDAVGMLNAPIITYKKVDLGGGAFFHAVDLINGYTLRFNTPGNYVIVGNLNATIVPVAGVFVYQTKASAFATTSSGGTGPSASDIADAVAAKSTVGASPGTLAGDIKAAKNNAANAFAVAAS
jgi:hypothetical protein